jgi:NADH-quinone oxidoreductase subunit L
MRLPLVVLSFLALTVGFLEMPHTLGNVTLFSHYLSHALPTTELLPGMDESSETREQLAVTVAALLGIGLAALLFLPGSLFAARGADQSTDRPSMTLLEGGWGFDRLYNHVFVQPWFSLTRRPHDMLDRGYEWLAVCAESCHGWMSRTQTGHVRWYAATIAIGALMLLGLFAI